MVDYSSFAVDDGHNESAEESYFHWGHSHCEIDKLEDGKDDLHCDLKRKHSMDENVEEVQT